MSRKHYKAIAEAIRENILCRNQREYIARALLTVLAESNPRFNKAKFIHAAVGE